MKNPLVWMRYRPMYPTSRTSFAAVLGIVGMFLLTLSTAFGWNPEIINGVQYIPMSEVRTHYKLTRERTEGRQKVYEVPEKIQIRIQARSQDMFMNNMKFVLSYPVADHPSKGLMVSNMDLHKIIDPVLRPTYIANRRSFNTVVIDPGHGGHDSGTRKYMDHINPNYPTRSKGVVEKCTFCYERIDKGETPLCVEKSKGTVVFGDLNDENSDVRKALKGAFSIRRRVELGSGPSVYYIIKAGE